MRMALILKLLSETQVEDDNNEDGEILVNKIHCTNPKCISSVEQELDSKFKLVDKEKGIYRCIYCECQEIEKENK